MGWCSGTEVFDSVAGYVLDSNLTGEQKYDVLRQLANALEWQDWDCQSDSMYWDHPIVQRIFRELHPSWDF